MKEQKEQNRKIIEKLRPHYIFNVLWNIQYLYRVDPKRGEKMLMDFSSFLRGKINDSCYDGLIRFPELFGHTRAYIEMEQVRASNPIILETNFDFVEFEMPVGVIQPLVENAIKHGLFAKRTEGKITVSTSVFNDEVCVTIEDDGVGFDINEVDKTRAGNIFEVEERMREYYPNAKVVFDSKIDIGTKVTITFTI